MRIDFEVNNAADDGLLGTLIETEDMDLNTLLSKAQGSGASDIHLKVSEPPIFRINGLLFRIKAPPLTNEIIEKWVDGLLSEALWDAFRLNKQVDISYAISEVGRYRVNIYMQQGNIGVVFRLIPLAVKSMDSLGLPPVLKEIANYPRGLILVTGATGSGKSTTLAAMIDHINEIKSCHVMTIEDPIEYMFTDNKSLINQREIGADANNFNEALRAALRQDPDVILIGEMRDLETIDIALKAAETGHTVFSTLHTSNAVETTNRIIAMFPAEQQVLVRHRLAMVLKAIISQRLVRRKDGKSRVAAFEILKNTRRVTEVLEEGQDLLILNDIIQDGYDPYRMQSFDQSLMYLLINGIISEEEAMKNVSNPADFKLRFQGIHSSGGSGWAAFEKMRQKVKQVKTSPTPQKSQE